MSVVFLRTPTRHQHLETNNAAAPGIWQQSPEGSSTRPAAVDPGTLRAAVNEELLANIATRFQGVSLAPSD